jgi:DNA-binding MarR family transcriptional regulator
MSGGELALRLFAVFRDLVDEVHGELAARGHPDVRPSHGFALQAVGAEGVTAVELARRLGVSKQAAGKTVDGLVGLGYAERAGDPTDARRKIVRLTAEGREVLALSARAFDRARAGRLEGLDVERVAGFEDVLRAVSDGVTPRLDAAAWLAGPDPS